MSRFFLALIAMGWIGIAAEILSIVLCLAALFAPFVYVTVIQGIDTEVIIRHAGGWGYASFALSALFLWLAGAIAHYRRLVKASRKQPETVAMD